MKAEKHLEKARRIEETIIRLDPEDSWELIVEGAYGAAIHYIAFITDRSINEHMDMHKGLTRFLDKHDFSELTRLFREVDFLRQSKWYGGQSNGKASKKALRILKGIKEKGGV